MNYKFKKPPEKEYGEFICPYCNKTFFNKTSLSGHIGGAHRRFTTQQTKKAYCKFCDKELVPQTKTNPKGNWPEWAVKQQNLICIKCKRKQNRTSYHKKKSNKEQKRIDYENRLRKMKENKKNG